jgi:hypothetical protein
MKKMENGTEFTMAYKLVPCGGVLKDFPDENVKFDLPQNYDGPIDCIWTLNIPSVFGKYQVR